MCARVARTKRKHRDRWSQHDDGDVRMAHRCDCLVPSATSFSQEIFGYQTSEPGKLRSTSSTTCSLNSNNQGSMALNQFLFRESSLVVTSEEYKLENVTIAFHVCIT